MWGEGVGLGGCDGRLLTVEEGEPHADDLVGSIAFCWVSTTAFLGC